MGVPSRSPGLHSSVATQNMFQNSRFFPSNQNHCDLDTQRLDVNSMVFLLQDLDAVFRHSNRHDVFRLVLAMNQGNINSFTREEEPDITRTNFPHARP